ncbi:uncharacterized protein LOC144005056 isoform X6 [Festucalex cinctus]
MLGAGSRSLELQTVYFWRVLKCWCKRSGSVWRRDFRMVAALQWKRFPLCFELIGKTRRGEAKRKGCVFSDHHSLASDVSQASRVTSTT